MDTNGFGQHIVSGIAYMQHSNIVEEAITFLNQTLPQILFLQLAVEVSFWLNFHSGSSPLSSSPSPSPSLSSSASPPPPPAPMIVIMSFKLQVQFRFRKHVFRGSKNIPMYKGLHNSRDISKLLLKIRRKNLIICESITQRSN